MLNREGELHWLKGEIEKGIGLVNQAYELFIKDHPAYRRPVIVDLPLRGTLVVAEGNDSPRTMTHAGLARYCFDFMGSDERGCTRKSESAGLGRNEDYYGFGMAIYSPVDGTVSIPVPFSAYTELIENGEPMERSVSTPPQTDVIQTGMPPSSPQSPAALPQQALRHGIGVRKPVRENHWSRSFDAEQPVDVGSDVSA